MLKIWIIIVTECTSQRLFETVRKATTMQSGDIQLTSPNGFYGDTESIEVCVAAVRRVCICSLLLCVLNAKLTMLSVWLMPHRLTLNKYYISQDSIDFKVVLSMSRLRAFRLERNVLSQAFFLALGLPRCILFLGLTHAALLYLGL